MVPVGWIYFFSAVRGSSPCAPDQRCAAERPVDLAWAAPNLCARAVRFPPGGIRARREPATPPGPPSPLGRCAPAFVRLRTAAWRPRRGARGRRVASAPSAPSYGAAAVLHFLSVKPALAPAGARSGPESRPFGLRSRLSNWGALVSLVPFDFKSGRQSGSIARSSTAAAWGNCHDFELSLLSSSKNMIKSGLFRQVSARCPSMKETEAQSPTAAVACESNRLNPPQSAIANRCFRRPACSTHSNLPGSRACRHRTSTRAGSPCAPRSDPE